MRARKGGRESQIVFGGDRHQAAAQEAKRLEKEERQAHAVEMSHTAARLVGALAVCWFTVQGVAFAVRWGLCCGSGSRMMSAGSSCNAITIMAVV